MLSYNESHGPLFQDAILNVKDLNAHKQEHAENEPSSSGATSSFQDESAPPAAPTRKAKRKRRKRNDREKATVSTFCTETLSNQTSAPLTSKKKNKSTRKKSKEEAKEEIELLDAAETDTSANTFDKLDTGQESQFCSGPTAEPKNRRRSRKICSATLENVSVFVFHDDEKTESSKAQIFSVDSPNKQTNKQRKIQVKAQTLV